MKGAAKKPEDNSSRFQPSCSRVPPEKSCTKKASAQCGKRQAAIAAPLAIPSSQANPSFIIRV